MIHFTYFVWFMLLHLIADFFLQSREMGKQKSSSIKHLGHHGMIHIAVFAVGYPIPLFTLAWLHGELGYVLPYLGVYLIAGVVLAIFNGLLHMMVDACTWNAYKWSVWLRREKLAVTQGWNKKEGCQVFAQLDGTRKEEAQKYIKENFKYQEDPWFYHTIGIDQFLHVVCIAIVYSRVLFGGL